ncbi:MAG TPA: glycosyltransferase family A protein [Terracidiphilus sp.]|nr:glycosyltransferase family A protein [Terracidiphilus sp.]
MQPKISVVIPLYNKQDEIERCLRSALAQTFADFEVLVVDDGSTDASAAKASSFTDPRVRLIRQANGGVARARNRAIEEAEAELIAFLDADDEWLPEYLENLMRLAEAAPQAGVYFAAYWIDRGNGMRRRVRLAQRFVQANGLVKDYFAAPDGAMTLPTAAAVRREAVLAAGGFRQMFGEDVDLFLRLAAMYPVAYSSRAAAVWHVDAGNRRCVNQKATVKLYEPGGLQASLDFLTACPVVSRDALQRARRFVAERERRAIVATLLQGQREHARLLLERWERDSGRRDERLEALITHAPTPMLRLWGRWRNISARAATAMAYAREWAVCRRTFRATPLRQALSN